MCARQPAGELERLRQAEFTPDAANCRAGQGLHVHNGLRIAQTQVALPRRWKWDSSLRGVVCPDVNVLLVDRAFHRDGPVECEFAAPCQNQTRGADIPNVMRACKYALLRARILSDMQRLQSSFVASGSERSSRARCTASRAKASTGGTSALRFHLFLQAMGKCTPLLAALSQRSWTSQVSFKPVANRCHVKQTCVFRVSLKHSSTGPLYLAPESNEVSTRTHKHDASYEHAAASKGAHARYSNVCSAKPLVHPSPGGRGRVSSDCRERSLIASHREDAARVLESWSNVCTSMSNEHCEDNESKNTMTSMDART